MLYKALCAVVGALLLAHTRAELLFGCKYEESLCEEDERCIEDGLLGQCQPPDMVAPSVNVQDLMNDDDWQLLAQELSALTDAGYTWHHARTQCTLAYFMFTVRYDLAFDPLYCADVRHPENIWAMLHAIQGHSGIVVEQPRVIVAATADELINGKHTILDATVQQMLGIEDANAPLVALVPEEEAVVVDESPLEKKSPQNEKCDEYLLTDDEEELLNDMIMTVISGGEIDPSGLSTCQLDKLIAYVRIMNDLNRKLSLDELVDLGGTPSMKRDTEYIYDDSLPELPYESALYKKDAEDVGETQLGLENTEHKIVKGTDASTAVERIIPRIHKIDGERVYVKLANGPNKFVDENALIAYLRQEIAAPNNVTFTDFSVDGNTISFRVEHKSLSSLTLPPNWHFVSSEERNVDKYAGKHFQQSSDLAEQIYKREKDILRVSGGRVTEAGVGDEEDHVRILPLRDDFAVPAMVLCGVLLATLVTVAGAYVYRHRAEAARTVKRIAVDIEARPAKTYEELCRQRIARTDVRGGVTGSNKMHGSPQQPRHLSSGSWSDEPVASTSMDITTGHMILSYMEQHLANKDKLNEDWASLAAYLPDRIDTNVARLPANVHKNRDMNVIPYDHNRVKLHTLVNDDVSDYINASSVCDAHNTDYIVTQTPLAETTSDMWQMIWEKGAVVIVNLTRANEGIEQCRYWPETGSVAYGEYEIHLVSEHIWCEDYVVRSFYLKNLRTSETRTVTQFHYVAWQEGGVPPTKSLLDFRRKVNKSYRGKNSPIVVHCNNGGGRSGTYCLIDMVLNRISRGGVKQLDVAACLEHMRDQRMSLVANERQYEFVLTCIAEETQAILQAMSAQH